MAFSVNDYLLDQSGINWPVALSGWSSLLPSQFTVWLVNLFADFFLVTRDGSVYMLDVGAGCLNRIANSQDEFCTRIDEDDNGNEWLMIPLVDKHVAAGITLTAGYCYGFKTPPVLGGQYEVQNVAPIPIMDYLIGYGSIHAQIRDLPDGAQVVIEVTKKPTER